ncbi:MULTISPECIES: hypothetical protein [Klebsiella/Raoultella group]|uniref:hypothetical protein n=1 Tax=Klebsiella/Raoultella group TaxID=2890311 RepID=UPI00080BBE29|nr:MULTISPECIES: hypothetical protein [Klebsiella/Raoultella group]HBR1533308.1 hypothetical protein [Klebsiella pneumoniae]HCF7917575.1 hypothetical protein [Klebsiella pneumoniae]HEQ3501037.1 hypothetical protein [Raoultella ornithinolytica]
MKASGNLLYGVQIGDVIHYDYTVTLPVMKHTVKALASTMDALGETDTPAAYVHYRVALLAEVLESLGSLSKDDITADFLLENLIEDDLDILDAELAGLKKKRMPVQQSLPDSGEPPSSSDDSASLPTA